MSPTARGKHAGTIRKLNNQLDQRLPGHLVPDPVVSVTAPAMGEDYATPDPIVLSQQFEESDEWLADRANDDARDRSGIPVALAVGYQ